MKNYKINASLTCIDLNHIEDAIKEIEKNDIDGLHYDVVDGKFNHCFMFGDKMFSVFHALTKLPIYVHLACETPELYIEPFQNIGAQYFIIHYESKGNVLKLLRNLKVRNLHPILGFRCDTEVPEDFATYAREVESILKLTVFPGFSGQPFHQESLQHIQKMKEILEEEHINIPIEVDGNINLNTISSCVLAGASIFTGGTSGLFTKEYTLQENIQKLSKKIKETREDQRCR